jgi:hypothetical protein
LGTKNTGSGTEKETDFGWLTDRLTDLLAYRLAGVLADRLKAGCGGWLGGCVDGRLSGWVAYCLHFNPFPQ